MPAYATRSMWPCDLFKDMLLPKMEHKDPVPIFTSFFFLCQSVRLVTRLSSVLVHAADNRLASTLPPATEIKAAHITGCQSTAVNSFSHSSLHSPLSPHSLLSTVYFFLLLSTASLIYSIQLAST